VAGPGAKEVLKRIQEEEIEWIHLQFTDLLGYLRQVTVHRNLLDEKAFERGLGKLDGSSVKGFTGIHESDLVLKPIPETFAVLPWSEDAARLISRVYMPGGMERLSRDPAFALEKAVEYAAENGYEVRVSAELEFHVFADLSGFICIIIYRQIATGVERAIASILFYYIDHTNANIAPDGHKIPLQGYIYNECHISSPAGS